MNLERFDDFFFTIVKETGGLEGLFHALFNFLFRRTDFFYESNPGDKMGFPPGVAPQIVFNIFQKYQNEQYKKIPKKDPQEYQKKVEEYKKQQQQQQQVQEKQSQQKEQIITEKSNLNEKESKEQKEQKDQKEQQEQKENYDQQQQKPQQSEQKIRKPIDSKIGNISTWNGDTTDKYSWSQSTNDITLQVNVPEKTRAKDVIITMESQYLKIILKQNQEVIIEGELYDRIRAEDSIWSIEDGNKIIFTLEKASENIWKTIIKGDKEIDATKVDNSKKLEEFDTETQAALRKIVYEQQRKQQGLPTTEEEKQLDMLQKAWNAEGSPFKGQPFDPTKFNLQGGNTFNM